jgi:hypothetical protein
MFPFPYLYWIILVPPEVGHVIFGMVQLSYLCWTIWFCSVFVFGGYFLAGCVTFALFACLLFQVLWLFVILFYFFRFVFCRSPQPVS